MPHSHRSLQQWNHWLTQPLGGRLLEAEKNMLPSLLNQYYGKHAMLIGVPNQTPLITQNHMAHQMVLSPLIDKTHSLRLIESELYELPVASSSIDLVLLPHTLEHIDNPHKLLSEACRIVKMEGLIIIFGFNPFSLWGVKKKLNPPKKIPWLGNFLSAGLVKKWLALADFELIKQDKNPGLYKQSRFMEWLGRKFWGSFGGVYLLIAQAKGIPLTPIKMHWKQQLSGVKATFTGPNMGNHWGRFPR